MTDPIPVEKRGMPLAAAVALGALAAIAANFALQTGVANWLAPEQMVWIGPALFAVAGFVFAFTGCLIAKSISGGRNAAPWLVALALVVWSFVMTGLTVLRIRSQIGDEVVVLLPNLAFGLATGALISCAAATLVMLIPIGGERGSS